LAEAIGLGALSLSLSGMVKRRWMSLGEEYDPSQPVADHIISTA
jgi:hypothetical protein